jgi:ketosteroid isomerase-like protein
MLAVDLSRSSISAHLTHTNMTMTASELLQKHIETLVDDAARWETLIADDLLWELAYAPSVGHPARLCGRDEVMRHVKWFRDAVDRFRFSNLAVHRFEDPTGAVGEVEAEGIIKSTGRAYRQNYVVFIRVAGGKITSSGSISIRCARPKRWTFQLGDS